MIFVHVHLECCLAKYLQNNSLNSSLLSTLYVHVHVIWHDTKQMGPLTILDFVITSMSMSIPILIIHISCIFHFIDKKIFLSEKKTSKVMFYTTCFDIKVTWPQVTLLITSDTFVWETYFSFPYNSCPINCTYVIVTWLTLFKMTICRHRVCFTMYPYINLNCFQS